MTSSQPGVPAWKKLGLKLKYANEIPERVHTNDTSITGTQVAQIPTEKPQSNASEPPKKRRKTERKLELNEGSTVPLSRNTNGAVPHPQPNLKKQVSFSADTKSAAPTANHDSSQVESKSEGAQTSSNKPKKKSAKKLPQPPAQKSNAALDYLDQYHSTRSTWKFNKNRETWILKHVFSEKDIPRGHNMGLAEYIHGLQGTGARERLKAQCVQLLAKETENENEGTKVDTTQSKIYLQRLMDELDRPATSEAADPRDNKEDQDYEAWVQQQPRPKLLMWALGLDEQLLSNGTKPKTSPGVGRVNGVDAAAKAKKRKNRTAVVDYNSSSSSSSSDNDSEEDEGDGKMSDGNTAEETSSSGSDEETSSSSDSESGFGDKDSES